MHDQYVKKYKVRMDYQEALCAIHQQFLGPNHVNATASEAENSLQTSTYDSERKSWNQEKFVSHPIKFHITL